jgi:hypothetical protein
MVIKKKQMNFNGRRKWKIKTKKNWKEKKNKSLLMNDDNRNNNNKAKFNQL